MDYRLTLHKESLGVTQRALKALRDELAERIQHELFVFQVPAGESGFLIAQQRNPQYVDWCFSRLRR